MQVILLEKIHNIGDLGEVVKVKQGFARNYLIPQGKAKRATPENLKLLEEKRAELEKAAAEKLTKAQEQAAKMEGITIQITQKAGVDGRLFGSVTNVDIVEALQALGHKVEKAMIRMPEGPLKHVGDFPLTVVLHTDVSAHITVTVIGDTTGVPATALFCFRPIELRGAAHRGAFGAGGASSSSSGCSARGGDSTHESPHTSHPLTTTAPPDAPSSPRCAGANVSLTPSP